VSGNEEAGAQAPRRGAGKAVIISRYTGPWFISTVSFTNTKALNTEESVYFSPLQKSVIIFVWAAGRASPVSPTHLGTTPESESLVSTRQPKLTAPEQTESSENPRVMRTCDRRGRRSGHGQYRADWRSSQNRGERRSRSRVTPLVRYYGWDDIVRCKIRWPT